VICDVHMLDESGGALARWIRATQPAVAKRTFAVREAVGRLDIARERLKRSREETISRLSPAIEFRSGETGEHVERIGHGAQGLGRRLGCDESRLYRPALARDDALQIMHGGRGTQFDTEVLDTFVASRHDGGVAAQ
jgi:response regulator RpfG family c-di-GMP phosphodiesterase